MISTLILSISAILALIPAAALPFCRVPARDSVFWLLLATAIAGPAIWIWSALGTGWHTGLAPTLWVSVLASLFWFALLAVSMREVWRLSPILLPYLMIIGILATIWLQQPPRSLDLFGASTWVQFHIVFSVLTYGLLTIGAIAGLAVVVQERALKRKRPRRLTRLLPSVADGERIQVTLLTMGAFILGFGLLSGMAAQLYETGDFIDFSHKIVLSIATFVIIAILLTIHIRTGIRGRRAARYFLVAYLFITLAYPGVKFVTDVVLI